jgi:hypothetical protein
VLSQPWTASARTRLRSALSVALGYVLSALILTWPLVTRLRTHLPLGTLGDPTVPYFNLWTLEWNALRLVHGYAGYWDAPLFHPARDTFAMSEPQGLTGWLFAVPYWLGGAVLAYNLSLLAQLWLNGWAGRHLLRRLGVSGLAADLGGLLFLGLPLVRHELGVLQLCAAWPLLLALAELVRLAREPSGAALVRLALWLVATAWTCIYYALFLGIFLVLALPFYVRPALFTRRFGLCALATLALVGLGLAPLVAAERRAVSGHTRSATAIRSGSSSVYAYVQPPRGTPFARVWPAWARPVGRRSLYPGAITCALALLGGWRARQLAPPRFLLYSLALFLLALFLSFGTRWQLAGVTPYALTAERFLPGFGQLRSPYRAALFVQLVLTSLAGLGLQRVVAWAAARRPQLRAAAPALCVMLSLAELSSWGFAVVRFPQESLREPWIDWLAHQPAGAVAMLPVTDGGRASEYVDTTIGMLQALRHGHPIVNGYSGFFPARTDRLMARLRHFPGQGGVSALRALGVKYVVVDERWVGARALAAPPPGMLPAFLGGRRRVFQLE